jgi:hypothetical protein
VSAPGWRIAGTYLEACSCDPICPCRNIDGVPGGRSTHGLCLGAMSWRIDEGRVGPTDVAGLGVVLALSYSDDEPGSPWTYALFVDERADRDQHAALEAVFSGRLGGDAHRQFPWAWKESRPLGARPAAVDIDHTRRRAWFRVRDAVSVQVREPFAGSETVTCGIPGHTRNGREQVVEELHVDEGPLAFALTDVCGFASTFDYRGPD